MRLALHMGTLRGFGSGVVGRSVLAALRDDRRGHELLVWAPREWGAASEAGLEVRATEPGIAAKLRLENATIRGALRSWRADALFSLGDTSLPACPVRHLLMVQQAYLAYPPDAFDFPLSRAFRLRFRLMSAYLRAALPSVRHVTVQSEHMRQAFCDRWRFPADRVSVVPSAVQPAALAVAAEPRPESTEPPYLAYVSGPGPHKNHVVLAEALAGLGPGHRDVRCRVTATREQLPALVAAAERLGVLDRFDFDGRVAAAGAMRLLRGAVVAVIPSRFESFGIPYYEALAMGVPVVASDRPCAREPLGSAGLFAPPDDGRAWAVAIETALDERSELAAASLARFDAVHWPWPAIAAAYLDRLESLDHG